MPVELIEIEKVAKIYSGSAFKRAGDTGASPEHAGCPYVLVEDLCGEQIERTARTLSLDEMKGVRVAPPQTVLFSCTATIGKVGITGTHMAPSNNLFAVEFDTKRVFPLYGMYCLSAMRHEFSALAKGAVYDSLRLKDFRKFAIPVPNISEQIHIAEKLSMIQKSIGLQQELIAGMCDAAAVEFNAIFEEEIDAVTRRGESRTLDTYTEITLNGAAKSKHPGELNSRYVSTTLLADWEIAYDQIPAFEVDSHTAARFQLHSGDIVMNRINQHDRLGRCGVIVEEPPELAVFGQNTLRIRVKSDFMEPLFLFAWLKHPFIKQYIQHNAKSSTSFQSSLSKQTLVALPVPSADIQTQRAFAAQFKKYLAYVMHANTIINKMQELQQVWYNRILAFCQSTQVSQFSSQTNRYQDRQYWISPTGTCYFYDIYLECIQVPLNESRALKVHDLPGNVDFHFVESTRKMADTGYGSLHHVRLHKLNANTVRRDWMHPEVYRPEDAASIRQQQLEDNGLISDQQDFGYIRISEEIAVSRNDSIASLLEFTAPLDAKPYTRLVRMPFAVRQLINQLSPFQQGIYEEFLLAMQPLAGHMVQKQMRLRTDGGSFPGCGIQDVLATVQLLERFGLLERKHGLQLDYFNEDSQEKTRNPIQDHQGRAVLIDTWTWLLPEGGTSL